MLKNTENRRMFLNLKFNKKAFCIFLFIFVIEVIIALFINDNYIRPYGGDVLVVIMIYYFCKSFIQTKPIYIVVGSLLFAYATELGQCFNIVSRLNLQDNTILRTVIGTTFSWGDIICYTIGAVICILIENYVQKHKNKSLNIKED